MRAFVATVGLVALAFAFGPTPIANAARSKLSVGESVVDLAASRDGRWLAAAPSGEPPVLFHVAEIPAADAEGTAVESPPGRRPLACPPASIGSLAFTPDSRFLVVKPQLEDAEM